MSKKTSSFLPVAAILSLGLTLPAAADVVISDPAGDDNGPGSYTYPTDGVYLRGSFDLTELKIGKRGVDVTLGSNLADPWGMDVGFSVQMVFVFIDSKPGGHTDAPPGLNVTFAEDSGWEKCLILSPQPSARLKQEIEAKAPGMAADLVVPRRTSGAGRTISGDVKIENLGEGDPASWKYQVVVQSNEGFPSEGDLLTRKVNEFEGQHRFGGGTDFDCDPHAMDILGDHAAQLAYECAADGKAKKAATLKTVSP